LFISGIGRNGLPLLSTELLTRLPNEGGGGGGEKWQWRHFPPMNYDHCGSPLSVYFQGRVYVVGCGEKVKEMETLDVAGGGQWTTLTFFHPRLIIQSMATVDKELFLLGRSGFYSVELDGDLKPPLDEWRIWKLQSLAKLMTVHFKRSIQRKENNHHFSMHNGHFLSADFLVISFMYMKYS
uniref:F-box/kelch-repeat protein n=1 Tax=Hymenolepis diminuta TaxID=6216 RepID=A0A0R3SZI0_HYMDI